MPPYESFFLDTRGCKLFIQAGNGLVVIHTIDGDDEDDGVEIVATFSEWRRLARLIAAAIKRQAGGRKKAGVGP
jgi:hypothetical protein